MPTIDISMIARLDELGAPHPPGEPWGPPSPAEPGPSRGGPAGPPTAAFRPPPEITDAPLGVERSTRAIRIENHRQREVSGEHAPDPAQPYSAGRGHAAARRSGAGLLVAVALVAAVAVAVAIAVVLVR